MNVTPTAINWNKPVFYNGEYCTWFLVDALVLVEVGEDPIFGRGWDLIKLGESLPGREFSFTLQV